MHCKYKIATLTAALALACITPTSRADEAPKIQRKILLKEDTSIPGHEGLMVRVEIPPGAAEGYHTHPADAFAFILEAIEPRHPLIGDLLHLLGREALIPVGAAENEEVTFIVLCAHDSASVVFRLGMIFSVIQ